jgi:hypothetical protein
MPVMLFPLAGFVTVIVCGPTGVKISCTESLLSISVTWTVPLKLAINGKSRSHRRSHLQT